MLRKIFLLLVFLTIEGVSYTYQNYSPGNLILDIGIGAGTASLYPIGSPQMTIHPSLEIILGAWQPIAIGFIVDGSLNFLGPGLIGTIAPMFSFHFTMLSRFDWYVALGMGLQLLPAHGAIGIYQVNVGFATGFNVLITSSIFWNIGMAIHAREFFGSTGIGFRFGNTSKVSFK